MFVCDYILINYVSVTGLKVGQDEPVHRLII